jgi:hypothetical protein
MASIFHVFSPIICNTKLSLLRFVIVSASSVALAGVELCVLLFCLMTVNLTFNTASAYLTSS